MYILVITSEHHTVSLKFAKRVDCEYSIVLSVIQSF